MAKSTVKGILIEIITIVANVTNNTSNPISLLLLVVSRSQQTMQKNGEKHSFRATFFEVRQRK